jgi:signal transduction histidine kinase
VGEIDLAPQTIDTAAFVRETLDAMAVTDPAGAGVPVTVGALPAVSADPTLLRQVLVNLIGNARKFSRGQPVPEVEIGAEVDGDGVPVLYVRDNGVGFDGSRAAELFEPFRRLHGGTFQGHGIGLSIVRRIVERHGGRVWATSGSAGGAVFRFTLQPRPPLH